MKSIKVAAAAVFGVVALGTSAFAGAVFNEGADVPQTLPGQDLGIIGGGTVINGAVDAGQPGDVADLYQFTWNGTNSFFDVFVTLLPDSQIFLFDSAGNAIIGNDDNGGTFDASFSTTLGPGTYFLGVSSWDNDPVNAGAAEMFTDNFPGVQTPQNPGPLAGWNTGGSNLAGTYQILINPEPATFALFGLGVVGFAAVARKRRRAAKS